jgi:hypothetical protein
MVVLAVLVGELLVRCLDDGILLPILLLHPILSKHLLHVTSEVMALLDHMLRWTAPVQSNGVYRIPV